MPSKTRGRLTHLTRGKLVKGISLCFLVIQLFSVFTVLQKGPNDSNFIGPSLLSSMYRSDASRHVVINNNIHDDLKSHGKPVTAPTVGSSNSTTSLSSLNISELAKDLVILESLTSATHVEYLKQTLNSSSKIYRPGSWDGAGIVLEEYKLILFTQGKVACTVFKQLARRMMGLRDWKVHNEPHIPHNPQKNGLLYLYHYPPTVALAIMISPGWTRALFVRDPKERTLSAYLDKGAKKKGLYITKHCCKKELQAKNMDANFTTCGERASSSFLAFLQLVQKECCCDPHWDKQSNRIDLDFRPYINFVGHFDHVQDETKRLLDEVSARLDSGQDLWKEFGASGWGSTGNDAIFAKSTRAKHQTSAITKLKQYYNQSVEALVDAIYKNDYDDPLLNFEPFHLSEKD
ncbi:sulfotransferase family protein [Nitzschia inconspicua]|uniref:Sulfotransferase family protein n=1 Tax=Nitzschia inconspicua TaxID=303405 RepID=A0A9K3K4R6_9STRA|nr:sulfotransferase family protein [Nitzschia inconspicua]KAG7354007.1 sulfotransferase family protein [Nitzschia inconspicua]